MQILIERDDHGSLYFPAIEVGGTIITFDEQLDDLIVTAHSETATASRTIPLHGQPDLHLMFKVIDQLCAEVAEYPLLENIP